MSEQEASNPTTSAQRLQQLCVDPQMRIIVAGNTAAPGQLLEILAEDQDVRVRQAVASNPNTPWITLEHLAGEFPGEFLHNPVGALQVLTHQELITINSRFWDALLREATIPPLWWNWLLGHPALGTRQSVLLHVQYAGEVTHLTGTLDIEVEARRAEAGSLQSSEERLQTLAHDRNGRVRSLVAANPYTPIEALHLLAKDEKWQVRAAVAGHRQAPPEVLQALSRDPDVDVREAVAQNTQTLSKSWAAWLKIEGIAYKKRSRLMSRRLPRFC